MVSARKTPDPLSRYVPRLLVEWLRDAPETRHRIITGTCVFADLSGYTAMTERLAVQGTAGAEETGEILNDVFEALLSAAYDFGAGLVKWGGDAVLLLFHGEAHAVRATRAAWVMQNTIARVGKVATSRGPMRVRMSVGVHTGDFHFMLVGQAFRELVVAGPAVSTTARMEAIAGPGDIVVSGTTAHLLEPHTTRSLPEGGHHLIEPPDAPLLPRHSALEAGVDLTGLFDPVVRDHLIASRGDYEHRAVASAFVSFSGTDALLVEHGPGALYAAVEEVISRVQDAAAEHGVVILTTDLAEDGGKVLMVSGVPNKPGDDCTRILTAATSITSLPAALSLRVGVTHGRVFAGDFGAPFRGTYSLAGDVINLAARLTAQAAAGTVITTPDVVARTAGGFVVHELAPLTAKGMREPIHAVSIARKTGPTTVTQTQLPLIGRAAELAILVAAEVGATGRQGGAIEVVGEAGIGKSRLLTEYEAVATLPVVRVDGDLYAPTRPYAAIQSLMRAVLGVPQGARPEEAGAALTLAVTGSAPHLTPWLPLLAIASGATVPTTRQVTALDAAARADRLRRVTSELLSALLDAPTAIIFNDTHAMDDASVAVIRQLCNDVGSRPWAIISSRRPDPMTSAFPYSRTLALATLTADDADHLVVAAASVRIPAPRRAELAARSGGNPLFLRALAETVAAGSDPDALPSEIEDVLTAHMDRLTPDERAWLRTASVLGTRVDPDLLAEITDEPFDPATARTLAEYIRPDPDGTLVFAHHLIQRTAYEALPFRRRRTLHARASYAIEQRAGDAVAPVADVLAIHCLHGHRFDAAWQYARLAGHEARDRYALAEAAADLDIALEAAVSIPGLPARELAAVAEDLAEIRFTLGQTHQTEKALALARRVARGDPHRLARLHLRTARQRHRDGRIEDALRWVTRGRALLNPTLPDDLRLLAELAECGAAVHQSRGATRAFRQWAERAADEAQRCGDDQRAASSLSQLAIVKAQRGEAWEEVDLSNSAAWNFGVTGEINNRLGVAFYYAGDMPSAQARYEEAEICAIQAGDEAKAAIYAANRAELFVESRRSDEAIPLLERAIDQLRSTRTTVFLPFALTLLGRAIHDTQGYEAAREIFEEALDIAEASGDAEAVTEARTWLNPVHTE